MNTRSSAESELVAADYAMITILWTKLFLNPQGLEVNETTMTQDNKSAIFLDDYENEIFSKRTRHLILRFFIKDKIEKQNLKVKHCSNDYMDEYFMTKPFKVIHFTN